MSKTHRLLAFLFSVLLFMIIGSHLYAQSGVFDRTGIIPGHGSYSSLPEESVDLFTGNVTLRYLDYRLPGPNGLDVEIWRVYNSKILTDQSGSVQADHKSWVGVGWTMHMGRVHNYDTTTPIIEFPDGRWETAYTDRYEPLRLKKNITRDFLRYDREAYKLYFQDGTIWTFGVVRTITRADGSYESVRLVNRIQNAYGHYITILYDTGKPSIDTITDSMGRVIDFISTGTTYKKLVSMKVKTATGSNVYYNYAVTEFSNGYHKLVSFAPPLIPATTYEYLDGTNNYYELTKVTNNYGGVLEFSYVNHAFYFNTTSLDSRVVSQKKITFNPGEQAKVWNFTYPSYYGTPTGTATVEGPEFSTSVTSHAYDASCPWRIGLITSRSVSDGSFSESYDWTYQQISNLTWLVLGTDMGTAKGPLLASVSQVPLGDVTSMTEYLYEREETKKYGIPTRINIYFNGAISPRAYTELTYFYEASTGFRDRYLLAYVSDKTDRAGSGAMLRRTSTSYFQETGKWGAVDEVRKYTAESTYHTWDFGYTCSDPKSVKITIDPPGESGTQEIYYSYGVQNGLVYTDGVARYARVISQYDSSVSSEENQHGGKEDYSYDSAGRVTYINRPTPFNDTSLTWRPGDENKVVITQGGTTVTRYWDGMGRETGNTETGGGTTLYYLKILDAEGRLKEESVGSTDSAHRYAYLFNNAGRVTRITDPLQKATNLSYSGTRKTVTDPEQRTTSYDYEDLPGKPTKLTDALGRESVHTFDALGRLIGVVFNGARTHSYEYNWLNNVLPEAIRKPAARVIIITRS
jgi:YD repeat-containing protein